MNGETYTHFHISVADEAGNVYGGHLTEAVISGTGELVLTEIEAQLTASLMKNRAEFI